jgi:ribosomal-protein-alanine N-acetyltransferase
MALTSQYHKMCKIVLHLPVIHTILFSHETLCQAHSHLLEFPKQAFTDNTQGRMIGLPECGWKRYAALQIQAGSNMIFRELETERLFLRNISEDDRDFIFRQFSNDDINRYLFDEEPLSDLSGADEIIRFYTRPEPRRQHRWVLVRKADGAKLGTCGFHCWNPDEGTCEVGYDLYPPYWGMGYMSEALRVILSFAADEMSVGRIDAHISIDNANSIRLAEKLGFRDGSRQYGQLFRGKEYPHRVYRLQFSENK